MALAMGVASAATATACAIETDPPVAAGDESYGVTVTTVEPPVSPVAATARAPYRGLADLFPEQTAAEEGTSPASQRWALLIGIKQYAGSTPDTVGSRQDAVALRKILLNRGWLSSNIMLLTDSDATAATIRKAVKWLASKTTARSHVIFHYAGHEMPFYSDVDGDDEYRDVAIWATDNRYVYDGDLGRLLGEVRARRMWIHFATCRAGGFDDPGIKKDGRIITYSSPESELSYEDPEVGHSVFGWFTIAQALRRPEWADSTGDGVVTVEEAFTWASNRVTQRTGGRQHPLRWDGLEGRFRLEVPKADKGPTPPPPPEEDCGLPICP